MSRPSNILLPVINYDHTLVLSVELSNKSWVLAAQEPSCEAEDMTAPANLALRQTTLDLRAPSRHDYAVSLDGPPHISVVVALPCRTWPIAHPSNRWTRMPPSKAGTKHLEYPY
jgi:hypothetical protein